MLLLITIRTGFMVCVPLFLILTGYLSGKEELNLLYYKKKFRIYITYVLASLACEIYSIFFQHNSKSIIDVVKGILAFRSAPYSWYVELYLAMILIIPFLNIMWRGIGGQKGRIILIISLVVISSLPTLLNVYRFEDVSWWSMPSVDSNYQKLIPDFFNDAYPITYYFIGMYIKEYGFKINKYLNLVLIGFVVALAGVYNYWRCLGSVFIWGSWAYWNSLFVVVFSSLSFVFFVNRQYEKVPPAIVAFFRWLSPLTLGIYLVSSVFDNVYYGILNGRVVQVWDKLKYYPLIVPAVFISSMLVSYIINIIYKGILLLIDKNISKK